MRLQRGPPGTAREGGEAGEHRPVGRAEGAARRPAEEAGQGPPSCVGAERPKYGGAHPRADRFHPKEDGMTRSCPAVGASRSGDTATP
jgi:hypothetical protein